MSRYTITSIQRRRVYKICLCIILILLSAAITTTELSDLIYHHAPKLALLPQTHHFDATSLRPPVNPSFPPNAFLRPPKEFAIGEAQPLEFMPLFNFAITPVKRPGMLVPDVIHYISLSPNGKAAPTLSYWQYLAIRSVLTVQRPAVIYL